MVGVIKEDIDSRNLFCWPCVSV